MRLQLKIGDIVYRNPLPGEYAMVNRQPSLHKYSAIYLKLYPVSGSSIRINPGICDPFNADFDGDEINISFLYSKIVDEYTKK